MNNKVTRITMADLVYDNIKNKLLEGEIKFGEKIVEEKYSEIFEISRTPLREALKRLVHEGFAEKLPNGRLKFIDITDEFVKEMYDFRLLIENLAISKAADNDEILKKLLLNINQAEVLLQIEDYEGTKNMIGGFSEILLKDTLTIQLYKMFKNYTFIINVCKRQALSTQERYESIIEEHRGIYEALAAGDKELALELNTDHVNKARDYFFKRIGVNAE
jgi:DNA-binding GntR family transcriptional regulator